MKKIFAIISLFALVLTSCEKEEAIVIGSGLDTITATIESTTDTKATLQDGTNNNVVLWEEDDPISVFIEQENTVYNVKYELNEGDGTTEGVFVKAEPNFEIAADATILAAVYPYDEDAVYADGSVSGLSTTDSYTYSQTEKVGPMAAKANGSNLSFKNVGALVQISTSNVPNGYNKIELSSATSGLQGEYSLSFDENGIPVPTLTGTGKTITFEGTSADQTVYFPVFAGSYSDLTVKAKNDAGSEVILISPKALEAVRNTIHWTQRSVITETIIAESGTISLTENNGKELTLIIYKDGGNHAWDITIEPADQYTIIDGIVNIMIDGLTIDNDLNINLPNATVNLTGTSTYTNINSTTASNTLILGKGVTAQKVTVNQGNVQVNEGATVTQFENDSTEEIVIIDNGGTIPDENTDFTKRTYAEHELIKAINDNTVNTHTLTGNVTLSDILTINKNFVLDGNGYTLTSTMNGSNGRAINVGESGCGNLNVTIKNLEIEASGQRAINLIQGSHNVTIENVTATSTNYTVNVAASAPGSIVTINKSTLTGKNTINVGAENTTMTVSESTLSTIDDNAGEGYSTITVGSYNAGNSTFLSGSEVSVQNCNFNIGGTQIDETYNVSYASSLNDVEIISSNPAQLSIEDVKAILPQGNDNYYSASTLDELIEEAKEGNTIKLVDNVTINEPVEISTGETFTIDLNNKTLKTAEILDADSWSAAIIVLKGDVTIKGGTIETQGTAEHKKMGAIWVRGSESATVTITDGTYKGNSWNTTATYTDDCMATIYVSNENGNVTINGGNFYCVQQEQTTGYNHILNYLNSFGSNQKIFVKGGKFYRMNPAVGNGTEQTYLNTGYTSAETTENDIKVFTVSAAENN
ncbi:MAG: hypothetical protein J6A27_05800 [Bacteroidales bacterium]|nr:hypothetical protein [Bacteroidales bacterium]